MIHALAAAAIDPELLLRRLKDESDVSARRAVLQIVGEVAGRLAPAIKSQLALAALELYRNDPDAGVHASAQWALRSPWWPW